MKYPPNIIRYAVAFDVSSDKLAACFGCMTTDMKFHTISQRKFTNTLAGFKNIIVWVNKYRKDLQLPIRFLVEATGVYHENLCYYLFDQDHHISVVLPNYSSKYLEALGIRSKTDELDAKGLCQMCAERDFDRWQKPNAVLRQTRSLTRLREQLQNKLTMSRNQLHAVQHSAEPCSLVIEHHEAMMAFYRIKIEEIETQIEQTLAKDEQIKAKVEKIVKSISGVGQLTLVTIISEADGFEHFHSQGQLTAYSGYDVVENQSGKYNGKTRISKKGNSHIRRIMHMAALNVVRYKVKKFVDLYERVFQRTAIKMKGYVAVQRKLLGLIYTLWKNDTVFNATYEVNQQQNSSQENRGKAVLA